MITLSYSGLRNLDCPFRFKAVQVDRTHRDPPTSEMELGSAGHKTIEALLTGQAPPTLPASVDKAKLDVMIETWKASEFGTTNIPGALVERKVAVDGEFNPCDFFSPEAMFRGIFDYQYLDHDTPVVVDWKTGHWEVDPKQSEYYSVLALAHDPDADQVETVVYNIASNTITRRTYSREEIKETVTEIWELSHRVNSITEWPATPCHLCDRCTVPGCPVRDQIAGALVKESKLPILIVPDAISTQSEAETALQFVLFSEMITDRIKDLLKGYVSGNGPVYAAGKVAQLSEQESWKPKDLALLVKSLSAWGVPKDLLWDNLSLTKTGLDKIVKKAGIRDREPFIRNMLEIKSTKAFGISNDKIV